MGGVFCKSSGERDYCQRGFIGLFVYGFDGRGRVLGVRAAEGFLSRCFEHGLVLRWDGGASDQRVRASKVADGKTGTYLL